MRRLAAVRRINMLVQFSFYFSALLIAPLVGERGLDWETGREGEGRRGKDGIPLNQTFLAPLPPPGWHRQRREREEFFQTNHRDGEERKDDLITG